MKKLITFMLAVCLFSAAANAQTGAKAKLLKSKTLKGKTITALQSQQVKAKLQAAKLQMRKEGE